MLSFSAQMFLVAGLALTALPASADVRNAALELNQGRLDAAGSALRDRLHLNPHEAIAHQMLCRVFYAEELAEDAIEECESAVADSGNDGPLASDNQMWLGRAYGLKASRANPVTAFRFAKKVLAAFTHAVELNPRNIAALSDLGEYYVNAPAVVGGGVDKAERLAEQMMALSASKAHRLRALTAEKRGDHSAAEAEFKAASDAQRTPEALVDLADFYQRRKQCDQALSVIKALVRMDRAKDAAIVDAASVLIACDREPLLAKDLLSNYLTSAAQSDSAPAPRVHVQLGDLLVKSGDSASAKREYEAALALSAHYAPARKALEGR